MRSGEVEDKIRTLSEDLKSRGIDSEEVEIICHLVAYINGVDSTPSELLDGDLPLAYEPQCFSAKARG